MLFLRKHPSFKNYYLLLVLCICLFMYDLCVYVMTHVWMSVGVHTYVNQFSLFSVESGD